MQRFLVSPRNEWTKQVEALGFVFHTPKPTELYWDESVCYVFSTPQIEEIEKATAEIYELFLQAGQHIIDEKLFHLFKIPEYIVPYLIEQWNKESPAIYGRFDFSYDGTGVPKMLEFNADTPTSLFEASIIQWSWLQVYDKTQDQYNSLHEKLIDYWAYLRPYLRTGALYFTCVKENTEDFITTEYLRDCAMQAGIDAKFIDLKNVGWNEEMQQFVDEKNQPIKNLFKLYPWEWLVNEPFGEHIVHDTCAWIEPIWKMIFSNKAILPILWELFPDNPYLLPAYFHSNEMTDYVKKPILSREGSNVAIYKNGKPIVSTPGEYGEEGFIFQALAELPNFDGYFPVIGSWIIGQQPAGIGIRESNTLVTDNKSRFVPHYIEMFEV
ncbi:MAG: glutathionylspermidine synthase family protein [Bacteroidia bacterium]